MILLEATITQVGKSALHMLLTPTERLSNASYVTFEQLDTRHDHISAMRDLESGVTAWSNEVKLHKVCDSAPKFDNFTVESEASNVIELNVNR